MIARYTGASLGLLAFTVTSVAGLFAGNAVTVTLSRSLFALFLFCVIGLVLGSAAQLVVAEYERNREAELRRQIAESGISELERGEPGKDLSGKDAGPPVVTLERAANSTG